MLHDRGQYLQVVTTEGPTNSTISPRICVKTVTGQFDNLRTVRGVFLFLLGDLKVSDIGCDAAMAFHNLRSDTECKNAEGLLFPALSWGLPPFSEPKNVTNQHSYEETLS